MRTEFEAFVDLYGILDRSWVGRCPMEPHEHCLMTGVNEAATGRAAPERYPQTPDELGLVSAMCSRLVSVTGAHNLAGWSDGASKGEVLDAVAACVEGASPVPWPRADLETRKAVLI